MNPSFESGEGTVGSDVFIFKPPLEGFRIRPAGGVKQPTERAHDGLELGGSVFVGEKGRRVGKHGVER